MSAEHHYVGLTNHFYDEKPTKFRNCFIFLLFICILGLIGISIFLIVNVTTSGYITSVEMLDPIKRSTEQGSGLLINRNKNKIKLKNTGTYDILPGLGIIVDKTIENYPVVSLNQSYINNESSCICQNTTIYINNTLLCDCVNTTVYQNTTTIINLTKTLMANEGIIMTPNPWNPSTTDATFGVNETYIRENLNLSTLAVSDPLSLSTNPWTPTSGDVNLTIMLTSLNATGGLTISPNPWNPATSSDATIQLDQQGFFAIMTSNSVLGENSIVTGGWNVTTTNAWTKGGFNVSAGVYVVPSSGSYDVDFKLSTESGIGTTYLRINSMNRFLATVSGSVIFLSVSPYLTTGDTIDIFSSDAKTFNGGSNPYVTWFSVQKMGI